jgi:hypothetical protein
VGKRGPAKGTGGRPRKTLSEKVSNGNPGKRPLKVISFEDAVDLKGVEMPKPNEVLGGIQRDGTRLQAEEIYKNTWEWLNDRGCAEIISPQLLERYAMACARWIHLEELITSTGYLIKYKTLAGAVTSPYVNISIKYMNQANHLWNEIFSIVRENSMSDFSGVNPQEDVMERLLRSRERK